MGPVFFEVAFFFAGVVIYLSIGSYYRMINGLLLAGISAILYYFGLISGAGVFFRILLQCVPFLVIMYRTHTNTMTIDDDTVICPVCGHHNEWGTKTCAAPRCDADLGDYESHGRLSHYFPPKLVAGLLGGSVVLGAVITQFEGGSFLLTWIEAAWPAFVLIALILLIFQRFSM